MRASTSRSAVVRGRSVGFGCAAAARAPASSATGASDSATIQRIGAHDHRTGVLDGTPPRRGGAAGSKMCPMRHTGRGGR
jgi:hypothetical protein